MFPLTPSTLYTAFAWLLVGVFSVGTGFWLYEILVVGREEVGDAKYGMDDIQVRIATVDSPEVVQATVASLPDGLEDIHVLSETEMEITGAKVWVVPDEFSCNAARKGRALEWGRRALSCEAEFVLFLDEDSVMKRLPKLPEADIVQFSERPIRSQSWITYLTEIFRVGFQIEQSVFPRLAVPLYAWGGGIAIKKEVEDKVTWDVNSVTEDTSFLWRAVQNHDIVLRYMTVRVRNQAPPSVRELFEQRRRWVSGALADIGLMPRKWQALQIIRHITWIGVIVSPLLVLSIHPSISNLLRPDLYVDLLFAQGVLLGIWCVIGVWQYRESFPVLVAVVALTPIVSFIHSVGAFWAILSPVDDFRVTEKVPPKDIEDDEIEEHVEEGVDDELDEALASSDD